MAKQKNMAAATLPSNEGPDFAELGRRLRAARARAGITRRQLAVASGTSERYLAHLESGTGNPSLSVLTALSATLDLAPVELLPQGGERSGRYEAVIAAVRRLPQDRLEELQQWLHKATAIGEKARRIALVGLRGAGKSSLGQALAERLGVPFLEMSREVERAYGGEIGLLIELGGQSALRSYEEQAWEAIRVEHGAAVIAMPGGIVANGPLYDRVLATSHSLWLQATPNDHMARVMAQGDFRPMASNRRAMDDLKTILQARSLEYARADMSLDTSAHAFDETLANLEQMARQVA
jgi:XRE family transcriptional regulator, aerobic/anaerobic benzoate catabolism transcriptional regulator